MNADQLHNHYYKRMMLCNKIILSEPIGSKRYDLFIDYHRFYRNLFDPK